MFNSHLYSMKFALLIFPIIAIILIIPYLIRQYQKYGSISFIRLAIIYSFIFYLITSYFLVMLPLYPRSVVSAMRGPTVDIRFLGFIQDLKQLGLLSITSKSDIVQLITNDRFLEPLLNVILLIPFGVYLRYYFRRNWYEVVLSGFLLSLFFEFSQLSGLYGFYSRPHRLFQFDDLFLNTIGSLVGFILTPAFVFVLPSRERLDFSSRSKQHNVSYFKRGLAFFLDWLLLAFIASVVMKLMMGTIRFNLLVSNPQLYVYKLMSESKFYLTLIIISLLNFVVIPFLFRGFTLGKYLVRIKLVDEENYRPPFWRLLLRFNLFYIKILILFMFIEKTIRFYYVKEFNDLKQILILTILFLLVVAQLYDVINSWYQDKPLAYERISGIKNISLHEKVIKEESIYG